MKTTIGGTRIGNQIKAGYYPTPVVEVGSRLQALIEVEPVNGKKLEHRWFDPCAGEGTILQYLAEQKKTAATPITTYAVELDGHRYEQCKQRIDHSIRSAFEYMSISNEAYSFIYLNPPYNREVSVRGSRAELMEVNFLHKAHRYLQVGGIMMYVIPANRYRLEEVWAFLDRNYTDYTLARFDDENGAYDEYSQVVFIGRKLSPDIEEVEDEKFLDICMQMDVEFAREHIPTLSQLVESGRKWVVPVSKRIERFRFTTKVDYKSSFAGISESDGFKQLENLLGRSRGGSSRKRTDSDKPKMPIASGQLGLLLCTGYANGEFGEGETYHIAQGSENVYYDSTVEILESGTTKEVITQKRRAKFIIATPDGTVKQLV